MADYTNYGKLRAKEFYGQSVGNDETDGLFKVTGAGNINIGPSATL